MSNVKRSKRPKDDSNDWFKKRTDNPRGLAARGRQQLRGRGGKASKTKFQWNKNKETKSSKEEREISQLGERCKREIAPSEIKKFADLPLSSATMRGLNEVKEGGKKDDAEAAPKFVTPTEIQRESIGFALAGRDILGAAKTGSGKTLAFLLPMLERLFRLKWSPEDGLGAMVISPTRELAYQTFEELRKVGRFHDFSAGLVIGGTANKIREEGEMMATCNIVVCTPGRLLQHMDETPEFDASNLQVLVLDEADRCLETIFSEQMNAIVSNLPSERQTLLFSATQTKSVKDLARLSLTNPVFVSVHEHAERATPDELQEYYAVCELGLKLDMLCAFIKREVKKKIIVFVSSCKQVKYLMDAFKKLRVYTVVTGLYGTLKQNRRMSIYQDFCSKKSGVLIATDVASRGLDFPSVDWVYQMDCPEDWKAYNHRVGRTARNRNVGRAMLTLLPTEEKGMVKHLAARRFKLTKDRVDTDDIPTVHKKLQAFVAADTELKGSAQRAFQAYLKSYAMMRDRSVFDVFALDTKSFAVSFGLAVPPRVRFLERKKKKLEDKSDEKSGKNDRVTFELEDSNSDSSDDDDDNMLTCKRKDHDIDDVGDDKGDGEHDLAQIDEVRRNASKNVVTKASLAKKALKKNFQVNERVKFDDDGEAIHTDGMHKLSEVGRNYETRDSEIAGIDIGAAREMIRAEDAFDKKTERERKKELKKEKKLKEKEAKGKRMTKAEKGSLGREESGESGDEVDSDDDEGPNLDWLPDPDKIYGKEDGGSEEKESSENEEESGELPGSKRKWKPPKKPKKNTSKKAKHEDESDDNFLNVSESVGDLAGDEELALKLLGR